MIYKSVGEKGEFPFIAIIRETPRKPQVSNISWSIHLIAVFDKKTKRRPRIYIADNM